MRYQFQRPLNHCRLPKYIEENFCPLFLFQVPYTADYLQIPANLEIRLISLLNGTHLLYGYGNGVINLSFRRNYPLGGEKHHVNKLEYYGYDYNLGVGYRLRYRRYLVGIEAGYRFFTYQKVDPYIEDKEEALPDFEYYNPKRMDFRITIGKQLGKSK